MGKIDLQAAAVRSHEVTEVCDLLDGNGVLTQPGWAKQLLWSYDRRRIRAPKWRIKEWDYYLVAGKDFAVAFTVSDDGYIGLESASLLDFRKPWEHTQTILTAFPMGKYRLPWDSGAGDFGADPEPASSPGCVGSGRTVYSDKRLEMEFTVAQGGLGRGTGGKGCLARHLRCDFKRFLGSAALHCDIMLEQPQMDTMVIATPWKENPKAFYYNQKINCMRASGYAELGGERYEFDPETDFGTLDWGRGVWTYDNRWYWSNGNGIVEGKPFGFNLGYGFGDTRAATENMLIYDGVCHKLADVEFQIPRNMAGELSYMETWRFTSSDGRFEAEFQPILDRKAKTSALVIESDQHQVFGKMNGQAVLDDGKVLELKDFLCFAEDVHNRY